MAILFSLDLFDSQRCSGFYQFILFELFASQQGEIGSRFADLAEALSGGFADIGIGVAGLATGITLAAGGPWLRRRRRGY